MLSDKETRGACGRAVKTAGALLGGALVWPTRLREHASRASERASLKPEGARLPARCGQVEVLPPSHNPAELPPCPPRYDDGVDVDDSKWQQSEWQRREREKERQNVRFHGGANGNFRARR